MSILLTAALLAPASPPQSPPTFLNVRIESQGSTLLHTVPDISERYEVIGELSSANNEGLAMFTFDLEFDGGNVPKAQEPASANMLNFASPLGLSNPAGFGGTKIQGRLVQAGGAQNTIGNLFAPQPTGTVITGIAQPGSPEILLEGRLTTPSTPGTYTLRLQELMANVIRQGETGTPFWAVHPAVPGQVVDLTIVVASMSAGAQPISVSGGGEQELRLHAGPEHAGRRFVVLGSLGDATAPATFRGAALPLAADRYFEHTAARPHSRTLQGARGALDAGGRAVATFRVEPGALAPSWAGRTVTHAFVLLDDDGSVVFVGDPVTVRLVP